MNALIGPIIIIGFVFFVLYCIFKQDTKDIASSPPIEYPETDEVICYRCHTSYDWKQRKSCPTCECTVICTDPCPDYNDSRFDGSWRNR